MYYVYVWNGNGEENKTLCSSERHIVVNGEIHRMAKHVAHSHSFSVSLSCFARVAMPVFDGCCCSYHVMNWLFEHSRCSCGLDPMCGFPITHPHRSQYITCNCPLEAIILSFAFILTGHPKAHVMLLLYAFWFFSHVQYNISFGSLSMLFGYVILGETL